MERKFLDLISSQQKLNKPPLMVRGGEPLAVVGISENVSLCHLTLRATFLLAVVGI